MTNVNQLAILFLLLAILGLVTTGCDQGPSPQLSETYRVEVKTDKVTYAQEDSILVSIRNI